jgi:hypothetical protein
MDRCKGYNYLMVFAELMNKLGLFATPEKNATVWGKFASE